MADGFNPRARAGRDRYFGLSRRLAALMFQSTRPRGARPRFIISDSNRHVSIHAPARGATRYCRELEWYAGFNPRARAGRDAAHRHRGRELLRFQSTRPRGARPCKRTCVDVHCRLVSIHAPARGATSGSEARSGMSKGFQSTRPRGARRVQGTVYAQRRRRVSIHAPARGATSTQSSELATESR